MAKPTLIVICGPTAVGKTDLSISLAQKFDTEIISADSRQFYKELKIGTAPPTTKQLKSVKHHFIGNLSISDSYDVYRYEAEALTVISDTFKTKNIPVMVGGSGLYINAVCNGLDNLPDRDEEIRHDLNELLKSNGIESLKYKLKALDPVYYNLVDLQNPSRIIRAIEVCLLTGKPFSSLRNNKPKQRNFNIIKIGLEDEKDILHKRINSRVDKMISDGLINEVKSLTEYRTYNSLNTVGYKEIFEYFDNIISIEEAVVKIKTNTKRYAKRLLYWFKKHNEIKWINHSQFVDISK